MRVRAAVEEGAGSNSVIDSMTEMTINLHSMRSIPGPRLSVSITITLLTLPTPPISHLTQHNPAEMSGENVQRFAADFKKVPGVLSITETHIAWNANTPGAMDRQYQALNRITSKFPTLTQSSFMSHHMRPPPACLTQRNSLTADMLASKAGAAKVSLKLLFKDDLPAGGLLFTFTNPTAQNRESDRLIVQDLLIPFVSANKGITPLPGSTSTPAAAATPTASASVPGTPAAVVGTKRKLQDEAPGSVGADSPAPSTGSGAGGMNPAKLKQMDHLRKMKMRVLEKNPTLAALYRELVWQPDDPSIKISEKEFWSGREVSDGTLPTEMWMLVVLTTRP